MADAVKAAGAVVNGAASYAAGKYNKQVSESQAVEAERDGAAEIARIRAGARAVMGQQISAQAGNGFQIGSGSALDALTESQINATLDALNARREASARARGARIQGAQAMSAGKNAYTAGLFSAASTVLDQKADWSTAKSGTSAPKKAGG